MNNIKELKIKLKELEANLENSSVQIELENNEFNLDDLKQTIQYYYKNIEHMNDEDLKIISTKVNELVSHSNNSAFSIYSHQFINTARYLINNHPVIELSIDDNLDTQDDIKISEEEFSKRYDELIENLNFEDEECNLILETPSEKKPFKIYKTKSKSLAIYANSSVKPMTIAADRLLEVAFNKKAPTYTSYETVIISKIMDNSIFDFFVKAVQTDLLEAMKSKLLNNENELLKLSSKLEEIEKNNQELSTIKQTLSETLEQSTTAKQEFIDTKTAAENYAKLNASVSYWQRKQEDHLKKFKLFGGGAIFLIIALVAVLFWALTYHENQMNESKKIEAVNTVSVSTVAKIGQDTNKSQEKLISTSKQIQPQIEKEIPKNEEKIKSFDFDYSKLAWYALMIFASSSAFWIIRITVKIALSNLHLSEDAHERVVMIQTYLSFVKEGQIEETDKNLILSSLFRPSNIGIIQDESSVTVADIVTAFKK